MIGVVGVEKDLHKIHGMLLELLILIRKIAERNNYIYFIHAGTVLGAVRHKGFIPWDDDADIIVPISYYDEFVNCLKKELPNKYRLTYRGEDSASLQAKILYNSNEFVFCLDIFPMIGLPKDNTKWSKIDIKFGRLRKLIYIKYRANFKTDNTLLRIRNKVVSLILAPISFENIHKAFDKLAIKYDYESALYVTNPCGKYGLKNVLPKSVYGNGVLYEFENTSFRIPERYHEYLTHYYGDYMTPLKDVKKDVND